MTGAALNRRAAGDARDRPAALPPRWPTLLAWFRWYGRGYVARKFHAVRLSRGGRPTGDDFPEGPAVVALNHPSWWDPMIGLVLTDLWPDRDHFAPIDSAALGKYRFFEKLGFFGVEQGTAKGGRDFLRLGLEALARPGGMLWVTAQGRFADARERPVVLKEGVGRLAARLNRGCVLPMALEYAFWEESAPEAFVRFGAPVLLGAADGEPRARSGDWTSRIASALEEAQDALAADVTSRDPSRFETLLSGRSGVGGVYDLWRRASAAARGGRFSAGHGDHLYM